MTQLRRALLATALFLGVATQVARAEVQLIEPTVDIQLPSINFDTNINPISGLLSEDALNIIRAHRVALQQVQAALLYLQQHRDDILAGKNEWYNENFGDFYDPNSPFAGLYNRILKHDTGKLDQFNKPIYEDWYNTAHYDRVVYVFTRIQAALKDTINYAWGAQTGNATNAGIFDTYRNAPVTIGDPLFGSPTQPDTISQLPASLIDPLTGLPFIDPVTMMPFAVPPLLGDPLFTHFARALADDRGTIQWGLSTSFTPDHLKQIATNPLNPLHWDDDNAISTPMAPLTPDQELAFFRDRLDAFAVTDATTGDSNVFVGGAFLNEQQRADSGGTGQPNQFFTQTEFSQYQQLISALAQSAGSLPPTGSAVGTTGVAIENGIFAALGANANFYQALDGKSYAAFADLFKPVEEGGIGDGTLLPPPGKSGGRSGIFFEPLVPGS